VLAPSDRMNPIAVGPRLVNRSTAHARNLELAATLFNSIVAGSGLDRVVVQMPAWRILGARPWADYSRRADLRNGMFLYPFSAIGGCALSIAAAIGYVWNRRTPRAAGTPILLSVLLTASGLALTTQAAPHIRSIRRIGDDPVKLRRAFDAFDWWGRYRAVVQFAAFCTNVWALARLERDAVPQTPVSATPAT
jgi:hypothetical protein